MVKHKCNKVNFRIECNECGYYYAGARYADTNPPWPCNSSDDDLLRHIDHLTLTRSSPKLAHLTEEEKTAHLYSIGLTQKEWLAAFMRGEDV